MIDEKEASKERLFEILGALIAAASVALIMYISAKG